MLDMQCNVKEARVKRVGHAYRKSKGEKTIESERYIKRKNTHGFQKEK